MNTVKTELGERVTRLLEGEKWAEAIGLMSEHEAVISQSSELSWNYGWALFNLNRLEEARPRLERALELDPANPVMWWALGVCEGEMGDIQSAEEHLRRALTIKDSYMARLMLSNLYLGDDRVADAEAVLREGVLLRPDHRERLEALAEVLEVAGKASEAQELMLRAAQLPPREARRRKQ